MLRFYFIQITFSFLLFKHFETLTSSRSISLSEFCWFFLFLSVFLFLTLHNVRKTTFLHIFCESYLPRSLSKLISPSIFLLLLPSIAHLNNVYKIIIFVQFVSILSGEHSTYLPSSLSNLVVSFSSSTSHSSWTPLLILACSRSRCSRNCR